jgi:hypothetical protein
MPTKKKTTPPTLVPSSEGVAGPGKSYRIRFRHNEQVDYLKLAAKKVGIPFNTFVNYVCELAAARIMDNPQDNISLLTKAVNDSLTER